MSEVIPEGWSAHELEDLISKIEGGGTPSRTNPVFWNGQVPWATVKDLKGIRLSVTEESITEQGLSTSASRLVPANTPIIATRMAVGKVVVFDKAVAINQDLKAIYPSPRLDAEFLLYWYSAHSDQIAKLATGSTVKGIRLEILRALPLTLPPLPEQQKIATILSSVDDVIEKTRAQIDKLKDLKTGMMQELLTQGIGHTEFKDSPVGRIPKDWYVAKIDDLVSKVGSGITPKGGSDTYLESGIPLIRSQNVHSEGLRLEDVSFISLEQHNKMRNSQLKGNDVLLNITGASIGRCYYLPSDFGEANVNQHVCIIRPKKDLCNHIYLALFLNAQEGQRQIMSLQAGGNREGLNFQQVRSIALALPPVAEQIEIAKTVSSIESNIRSLNRKFSDLADLKKALMQDLLTGKVRVKPDSPEVAAA